MADFTKLSITPAGSSGGGASAALDNLASVAINTSLISDTDSTDNLGSSSKYWANGYVDKIYLNSTATLDGSTAGQINVIGGIDVQRHIAVGWDATLSDLNGIFVNETFNPTAGDVAGIKVSGYYDTAFASNGIYGMQFELSAYHSTGTANYYAGFSGGFYQKAAGTTSNAIGGKAVIQGEAGTILTGKCYTAQPVVVGGAITNLYGYYLESVIYSSGTVANQYGIYLNDVTRGGTLNYAIYTNAGLNHFGGALEIVGNINPTTDSARDLGTSSLYFANTYTDKLYLNSTATLDGITAGKVNVTGIIEADGYNAADSSAGISGTLTTADLVGKTLTFKNGIITGYA